MIGREYARAQLAAAFITALSHEDAQTRERAEQRVERWRHVMAGMARGRLRIGSRTPVEGLPSWVTLEVVRGGFATGVTPSQGRLLPHEHALVSAAKLRRSRQAIFAHLVGDDGLAELNRLLDSGRFEADVPEETALLTVAWLLRAGDRLGALTVLTELAPFAARLRFAPRPTTHPPMDPEIVSRATVAETSAVLARRRHNERVETMRETLLVWNPFADDVLDLWLDTVVDGRIGVAVDVAWRERARLLLDRYAMLAAEHRRSTKHQQERENLPILLEVTREVVRHTRITSTERSRVQHVVGCMLRRRGAPGSPGHAALRERQAHDAHLGTHHALAQLLVRRLAAHPPGRGIRSPDEVLGPVTADEADGAGLPAGSTFPSPLRRVVHRALAAHVDDLVTSGVVPSAEVLAELVPAVASATTARAYPDPALQRVVGAAYRAFRRRRSLLLLNMEHQVRFDELPWIRALEPHRLPTADSRGGAAEATRRLAELALAGFPSTLLPNSLVRELDALATEAGVRAPFVEELAADIFEGDFSPKFLAAAKVAGSLLGGSLYERYYGIDYAAVRGLADRAPQRRGRAREASPFAKLCIDRAGVDRAGDAVAANGMIIEHGQILTTHNLATLFAEFGVQPQAGWPRLAEQCWTTVISRVEEAQASPRPLTAIKNAAYAWRQLVFFLSLVPEDLERALAAIAVGLDRRAEPVRHALAPVIGGLSDVAGHEEFDADGRTTRGRRLLGWTTGPHWLQEEISGAVRLPRG